MTNFNERLQKLIKELKTNANGFSSLLGYDKPEKIYRLLRDEKHKPSFEVILDISNKFEWLNIEWLINGRGEMILTPAENKKGSEKHKPTVETRSIPASKQSSAFQPGYNQPADDESIISEPAAIWSSKVPHIVTINEHGIDNIVYVPVKARAGYLLGHADPEFIAELPTFRMPGLNNTTYRMFEVEGISMTNTLCDRDRVICEWVPSLDNVRENRVHVIVTHDGLLIKRVLNRIHQRGKLYLKSDTIAHRSEYPLIELSPEDIQEIWYVNMKVSSDLSEPSEIYQRVSDLEIFKHEVMKRLDMGDAG